MKISFSKLSSIRIAHKDKRIVFCSGCFDLTHAGHVLFFEDCKKYGDILVVMLGSDNVIKRDKGNFRPILNESLRLKLVDSLRVVDYTFLDDIISNTAHPLDYIDHVFNALKPDVYVINEDAFDIPYRKLFSQKNNVELIILPRFCPPEFNSISTTQIINKIKSEK